VPPGSSSGSSRPTADDPRQRAIAAARELAEEGGYDAVQIRDIVARTGLSSATIYRHFSSKDHLIASAHLEWNRTLPRRYPGAGSRTAAGRVAALLHQTCMALESSPNLGRAVVFAIGASDPGARACRAEAIEVLLGYLREAIADEIPRPEQLLEPLSLAWGGALYAWAHGQLSLDEVDRRLQRTARLLLAGLHAESAERAARATRAVRATRAAGSRQTGKPRGRERGPGR